MLVKYIDSNYIIEDLQKPSWGEVEEPDFYITMASNRVKALIFPSEQGDPNNLESYTEEQQEAIKLATAIYTLWYFDTNYDFTNGSVSVNFGGVSMSESKTYNGEMVLPNVFDILKQANLIPTTETFIFNDVAGSFDNVNINPEAFKNLQQEMEKQSDNNIRQDLEIVKIYDRLSRVPSDEEQEALKKEVEAIQEEQEEQNQAIQNNASEIQTNKNELRDLYTQMIDLNEQQSAKLDATNAEIARVDNVVATNSTNIVNLDNKVNANEVAIQTNTNNIIENQNNIVLLDSRLLNVSGLLNQTIDGLRTLRPFKFVGLYDSSRTYMINEMVSLNDVFYLSLEDNNTTTPPGDKWIVMKDFQQVDLSEYPTKNEVLAIQNDLEAKINQNVSSIQNIKNNFLDKTFTGNNIIAGNSTYFTHSVYVNQPYNSNMTPNFDFVVNGDSSFDNANFYGNVDFIISPTAPDPTAANEVATKGYVDSNSGGTDNVKLSGNQTISGTKTFNNSLNVANGVALLSTTNDFTLFNLEKQGEKTVKFLFTQTSSGFRNYVHTLWAIKNGSSATETQVLKLSFRDTGSGPLLTCEGNKLGFVNDTTISGVATPTADNQAANKGYVDSQVAAAGGQEFIRFINDSRVYSNLQRLSINPFSLSIVDYTKPIYVSFTRYNNNVNLGTTTRTIIYESDQTKYLVSEVMYSSTGTNHMEIGNYCGLHIKDGIIEVQCWDTNDRVGNIRFYGYRR